MDLWTEFKDNWWLIIVWTVAFTLPALLHRAGIEIPYGVWKGLMIILVMFFVLGSIVYFLLNKGI